ncbi:hypothetical protein N7519_010219 [Penicillium mononematosum]|uniref:uncharacterized protein n=1 Tax=Penicillium mononematosum TaxID=268346 RepID=UPI002547D08D|nr:uncharacterized protein N7519_010219 [Penicillium mononematosum]KAJ6179758.1 hypothetical protein N7519_010219 [Penicillium mononematosum]
MTEAQFPYDITSWPMESLVDSHMGQHDELSPHPFIASDYPLTMQEGLDPSWGGEQFSWVNEYPAKSTAFQPYPQMWYDAGLVREDCGGTKTDIRSPINSLPNPRESPDTLPPRFRARNTKSPLHDSLPQSPRLPLPGSPSSDPNASPEPSHASSSVWEGEAEREDAQYMQFDFGPSDFGASALDAQYQPGQTHSLSSPHHRHSRVDEECLTPLEMPDGSTRLTSNWLPVDPDAGFAIGSPTMVDEDVAAFQDMKHAFFPAVPAAWSYDR